MEQALAHAAKTPAKALLLDFYRPSCAPCTLLSTVLGDLLDEDVLEKVVLGKINVYEDEEGYMEEYAVSYTPTLILLMDGKVADRYVVKKIDTLETLRAQVDKMLMPVMMA